METFILTTCLIHYQNEKAAENGATPHRHTHTHQCRLTHSVQVLHTKLSLLVTEHPSWWIFLSFGICSASPLIGVLDWVISEVLFPKSYESTQEVESWLLNGEFWQRTEGLSKLNPHLMPPLRYIWEQPPQHQQSHFCHYGQWWGHGDSARHRDWACLSFSQLSTKFCANTTARHIPTTSAPSPRFLPLRPSSCIEIL